MDEKRTVRRTLHNRINLPLDPHTNMVVKNPHLPPHRDARPCEGYQCRRDVALPEMHDHVGQADHREEGEVRFGFGVVEG